MRRRGLAWSARISVGQSAMRLANGIREFRRMPYQVRAELQYQASNLMGNSYVSRLRYFCENTPEGEEPPTVPALGNEPLVSVNETAD